MLSANERDRLEAAHRAANTPQLTVRALVTGMFLSVIMALSNLYVGLKTGWGLGTSITSCVLAFAVFQVVQKLRPNMRAFSILENNTSQTVASAAGYMSSGGLVTAIPALYFTDGRTVGSLEMSLLLASAATLGVVLAIPMKRQLINIEELPFPTGLATAETLKGMYAEGKEAMLKARALGWAGLLGALIAWCRDAETKWRLAIPAAWAPTSWTIKGIPLLKLTLGLELSLIMIGAGAIIGIKVGVSLLLGALINYGILAPHFIAMGVIKSASFRDIARWSVWPGAAIMVSASLVQLALDWRTIARSLGSMGAVVKHSKAVKGDGLLGKVEIPSSWFLWGFLVTGIACVVVQAWAFHIQWWMGIIAVLTTLVLSIVAARATGETDITPIGAMGKITQLLFGIIAPGNTVTNLMTASVTAGASGHTGDLLVDVKAGYLLGANPRRQFVAQLFGITMGTLACVPVYNLIVDPAKLGSDQMPAPAAQVWASVAKLLKDGVHALPASAVQAALWGVLLGALIPVLARFAPKTRRFLPSPTALGIAFVVPGFSSIAMFIGSFIAWLLEKYQPRFHQRYTLALSSGVIAGESLMGILVALLTVFHVLG